MIYNPYIICHGVLCIEVFSVPLAADSDLFECATYWGKFIRRSAA